MSILDIDTWQEIWSTLRRNKLRAALTACGVFWGLFMLIVMLGLGKGLENGTRKQLRGLAAHSVFIWGQRTSLPYHGLQPGRYLRFRNDDVDAIRRVPGVEHVAQRLQFGGWRQGANIVHGTKTASFGVMGDTNEYPLIEPLIVARGRFVNDNDMRDARKVAVIGRQVEGVLFENEDPIGKNIQVRGVHFQVVGVIRSQKGGEEGERLESQVFIPFSTFQQAFNERDHIGWFSLTARADVSADQVEAEVKKVLRARHGIHPDDPEAIGSFNAAEQFGKIQGLFAGIRTFVWFVGTLTLFAGVLGVSNILLIIVKERTKEIGIRKALGATPGSIIALVVEEAVALTALSGYAGLVCGVFTLELIGKAVDKLEEAPLTQPSVDLQAALLAAAVLVVAGVVAGIVPARHAAKIHPVEALRAE
ncbi:MAG TPA: ABC transporter permease [Polyangiaceae bacterium]|jgi:putative ABC transport system permease protein|nr:ABC transporter permease [Polyangiaceae bacterium]